MKQYIPPKDLQLDDEEKELLRAIESGEIKSRPLTAEERAMHMQAARNTLKRLEKDRNISLRLSNEDLSIIKTKAQTAGIPYQTLVGAILHQYASGKLKIEL